MEKRDGMRMTVSLLTTLCLCLGVVGEVQAALVNPGFETGDMTGWTGYGNYYVGDPNDGVTGNSSEYSLWYKGYYSGAWQSSGIVMEEGVTYTLSGLSVVYSSGSYVRLDICASSSASETGDVMTGGYSAFYHYLEWATTPDEVNYACDAAHDGMYLNVLLQTNSQAGGWVSVDDIAVTPEPATMGLLAVGGLGVLVRRKR
jgi:hypothetical protein